MAGMDCDFDPDVDPDEPELYAPTGESPLLLIAEEHRHDRRELDKQICYGIVHLFLERYGVINLVRGMRAWDAIVADLGSSREEAAD